MLSIYRRHRSNCPHADDRISSHCRCGWWATGSLFGKPYRKSLKTRDKEAAQKAIRKLERGEEPKSQPKIITIKDALDAFLKDCESRNLNPSTLRKYHRLKSVLEEWRLKRGLHRLGDFRIEAVRDFRGTWKLAPRTAAKELERLRAFFKFCVENDWIQKNPAKAIKAPEIRPNPTLPFTENELSKILTKTDQRSQVFFRVLLHSGLRIIDAAQLRPEKITDGRLFLYTQKTGTPVFVPLPPDLLHDLSKLRLVGGLYFAVESDNPITIAEYYRVKLEKAAIAAGLMQKRKKGEPRRKNKIHPHRFRDTFAVRLLEKGVPLETVSILLGHTDIKTTQRSYAPWVKSLQDNLERAVRETWQTALVRVK